MSRTWDFTYEGVEHKVTVSGDHKVTVVPPCTHFTAQLHMAMHGWPCEEEYVESFAHVIAAMGWSKAFVAMFEKYPARMSAIKGDLMQTAIAFMPM